MKYKEGNAYYIEWWDHCNDQGRWEDDFKNDGFGPIVIKSLGWVVRDEKNHVVIAQNSGIEDSPSTCAHMLILKVCVKKSKKLDLPKS